MNRSFALFIAAGLSLFGDVQLQQILTFSVSARNELCQIFGPAPVFEIKCDEQNQSVTNYYTLSTNQQNKKIMAYLDQDMPDGTGLVVYLTPPKGARSLGVRPLSATPIDLVIEISNVSQSGLPLTYTFSATSEAEAVPTTTRIVTYMIVDG